MAINQQRLALALVGLGVFFAPILGGKLPVDNVSLGSGLLDPARAQTAHVLVGLCFIFGLLVAAWRGKVLQTPQVTVWGLLLTWVMFVGASTLWSDFRTTSITSWVFWLACAMALLAVVATAGRDRGPILLVGSLLAGTAIVAVIGILEYGSMRAGDPSWRIFSTWMNPNALAGMLVLALPLGLSLLALDLDRLVKLLISSALVLVGLALILTQSKGGFASVLGGMAAWFVVGLTLKQGRKMLMPLGVVAVIVGLGFAIQNANRTPAGGGALSRVVGASGQAEQSVGFRQNLWRGGVAMIRERPIGFGPGTYNFESGRSKLTTQTQLTHQGFLQMAIEGGVVTLLAFLAFGFAWFWAVLRGSRTLNPQRQAVLAGVIGAVVACGIRNMIDSDWWHFGIAVSFFAILGLGLQVAADGSSPELMTQKARKFAAMAPCVFSLAGLLLVAIWDVHRAAGYVALAENNASAARSQADTLALFAPIHPDAAIIRARTAQSPEDAMRHLAEAAAYEPSTQNIRTLARFQAEQGDAEGALVTLRRLTQRDPYNLPALLLRVRLELDLGNSDNALSAFELMKQAEQSSYVQVRAIPEIVPTEIAEARIALAMNRTVIQLPDPDREPLLTDALKTLKDYIEQTVTRSLPVLKEGQALYPGEDPTTVRRKLELGLAAAEGLRKVQRVDTGLAGEFEAMATGVLGEIGGA